MIISDQQREENFQEYLRLREDPNYYDVTFDEKSGGVSAVHIEHMFDKQIGPFGYKRGQYESDSASILRNNGHTVILESEYPKGDGVKICDATLDGLPAEIKAIEGGGRWAICSKLVQAIKQGADWVILRFPDKVEFSRERIEEGWSMYLRECAKRGNTPKTVGISAIVEHAEVTITKPPR